MSLRLAGSSQFFVRLLQTTLTGPQMLAFLPAIVLGGYWFGGEAVVLLVAVLLPILLTLVGAFERQSLGEVLTDPLTGLSTRDGIISALDSAMGKSGQEADGSTAALTISLDDFKATRERYGARGSDALLCKIANRISETCRDADLIGRLDGAVFAVVVGPQKRIDLEAMIQLSGRIQEAISEPLRVDSTTVYVTASVGFALPGRVAGNTGKALIQAAECAMADARRNGPSAIRAFSTEMLGRVSDKNNLVDDVVIALNDGQIRPWFQPQISTHTGRVTGFEALARWIHPKRGLIPPSEFLPAIEAAGQMERLSEVMLSKSFAALQAWDSERADVPTVGVNFATDELRNPNLTEKIRWELDRFDLKPERLTIEILETVVADPNDDVVCHNIAQLAEMGCAIDLDDFGTGHASIGHIRQFAIGRIKIDRSYVMKADQDQEQQKMIAAILTMAERLDLDTLAEGVETTGEHAILAQLGCGHVQGFGIAKPMPFEDTLPWIDNHNRKLHKAPEIQKRMS